jgi:hypothetical protein
VQADVTAGVFRRRDLLAWGVNDAMLQVMFRRGLWVRLRHGVYADARSLEGASATDLHRLHLAAAIAASDEVTLAFGPSAALMHRLPVPFEDPEDVHILREATQDLRSMNRPSRHSLRIPSMRVTSHKGAGALAMVVEGVPSVPATVAAVSTAPIVSFSRKVGLFDAVLWDGTVDADTLRGIVAQWPQLGQSASTLDAIGLARKGAQTYLETYSRLVLVRQGLPEPLLQVAFHDGEGLVGIVDMYWPELRVVGEADGAIKYSSRQDLVSEKRREDRLRGLGLGVVRWMMDDLTQRPEAIASAIRRSARVAA